MKTYLLSGLREDCSGCAACADSCPVGCLSMKLDEKGFAYPFKDASKCIDCGKCERVCPMSRAKQGDEMFHLGEATYCVAGEKALESTSGGVFTNLAKAVLSKGGCVFGCKLSESFHPKHVMVESENELKLIRGSKYLQSDMTDCYKAVKNQLTSGREVLFSGTPCQVAGLYSYLGKEYDALTTVDIFCHGVPSAAVFDGWVKECEEKYNGKITDIKFRPKEKFGWQHCIRYTVTKADGKKIVKNELPGENPFYYFFLYGKIMRDSCKACPYSRTERVGDISLGDCWSGGTHDEIPYEYLKNGLTFVMCNTEKGARLFKNSEHVFVAAYPLEKEQRSNSALNKKPTFQDYTEEILANGVLRSYKKYASPKIIIKEKIKRILNQKLYFILSRR